MVDEEPLLSASIIDDLEIDVCYDEICSYDYSYEEVMNEPLNYVAGYICKKLDLEVEKDQRENSWVFKKGEGRLKQPSTDVYNMVVRCDALFDKFNTNKKINNPIEKCCSYILAKEKNYPLKVVKLFCKVKFFSRIRQLNEK